MSFNPQKAVHSYKELEKKTNQMLGIIYAIFEKYDGWYGYKRTEPYANVVAGTRDFPSIMSRNKREIPSMLPFSASLDALEKEKGWCISGTLIFEILVDGVPVFKDLNGILNRKSPAEGAYLRVHDFIPDRFPNMPFEDRYPLVQRYVALMDSPKVRLATILGYGSYKDVQSKAEEIWARNSTDRSDEGAIGKNINAPYVEGKRNKDIIKVKHEVTLEMEVVGVECGEGKYSHTLGKLIVQQANGNKHSVSGMSDAERDSWWSNPELIIGKVVEIQAMQVLKNGSLREGRFKCIRFDKNEID